MNVNIQTDKNASSVQIGSLTIWFSYRTPIAFENVYGQRVVRVNDWSMTTGKHLNAIDGGGTDAKAARVSGARFEELLDLVTGQANDRLTGGTIGTADITRNDMQGS